MAQHAITILIAIMLYAGTLLLALVTYPLLGHYGLARAVSPLMVVLSFLFIEHFVGLGDLRCVSPILLSALLYFFYKKHRGAAQILRQNAGVELAFLLGFSYCFVWRFAFPSIDPSSEKMADFSFVCNYMSGARLPPMDLWMPPMRFDFYYSLQHYAAAFVGRLMGLGPGMAYHLGYCLLIGLTTAAAYGAIAQFCAGKLYRALVVMAMLVAGTGASVFIYFMAKAPPTLHASMRFIGSFTKSLELLTPFGQWIAGLGSASAADLPVEVFSYAVYLGDYHAPLAGHFVLALALFCMGLIENALAERAKPPALLYGILLATVPVAFIANTWVVPLQALMIGTWIWHPLRHSKDRPDLLPVLAVVGGVVILIFPFLTRFASNLSNNNSGFHLVQLADRAPMWHWFIMFWPSLILIAAACLVKGKNWIGPRWALMWCVLFLFAELFYVKDIYGGPFNRFNTYLKWMPWIYGGSLISLGALCLGHGSKALRVATLSVLCLISAYGVLLAQYFTSTPKVFAGKLEGDAWITADIAQKAILRLLKESPPGVVLEHPRDRAFNEMSAYALFSGQPAHIGWIGHEFLWRGASYDIEQRFQGAKDFYDGKLGDPLSWLEANHVRYIIWLAPQNKDSRFAGINTALAGRYFWRETYRAGDFRVGFWEAKTI